MFAVILDLLVWIIVGILGGLIVARILNRKRRRRVTDGTRTRLVWVTNQKSRPCWSSFAWRRGDPQASPKYSVDEMISFGLAGWYKVVRESDGATLFSDGVCEVWGPAAKQRKEQYDADGPT